MKNQQKPASFINKLYSILKSKQHTKVIIWDCQLKGIRVLNQRKLQQTVLPRYYRHNRFASFVRQLNMYDFHKIHLGDHKSIFCHQHFDPKKQYLFILQPKFFRKQTIYIVKRKVTFNIENSSKNISQPQQDKQFSNNNYIDNNKDKKSQKSIKFDQGLNINFNENQDQQNKNYKNVLSLKLFKNSMKLINPISSEIIYQQYKNKQQQIIQQIINIILPLNLINQQMKQKIIELKKDKKYRNFFRKNSFKLHLYQRLGLQLDKQNDKLSQLSIQQQLLIQTRKTLTQKSLKLLESGQLMYKQSNDFINNLMQFQ